MTRVAAWGRMLLNVLTGNDGVNEVLEGGCDSSLGGQGAGQSSAGGHCESCRHGQRLLPLLSAANRRDLSLELQPKYSHAGQKAAQGTVGAICVSCGHGQRLLPPLSAA